MSFSGGGGGISTKCVSHSINNSLLTFLDLIIFRDLIALIRGIRHIGVPNASEGRILGILRKLTYGKLSTRCRDAKGDVLLYVVPVVSFFGFNVFRYKIPPTEISWCFARHERLVDGHFRAFFLSGDNTLVNEVSVT